MIIELGFIKTAGPVHVNDLFTFEATEFCGNLKAHGWPSVGFDKDLFDALDVKNVAKRYQSAGAAGGKPFEDQLKAWKERLGM